MNNSKKTGRISLSMWLIPLFALAGICGLMSLLQVRAQQPNTIENGGTNGLLLEYWVGLDKSSGIETLLHNARYPLNPDVKKIVNDAQAPENFGVCYGARMRGWIVPPATGDYTFWITADDNGQLWLSPDDNPAHRREIAHAAFISSSWTYYPEQQSAVIRLEAGKMYYIEALLKQGTVRDHLALAWQIPGGTGPELISGKYLIPYNQGLGGEGLTRDVWTNLTGMAAADLATNGVLDHAANVQGQVAQFEAPGGWGNNYAQRVQGYIHVPTNGTYTFWVAGSESAVLMLGADETPLKRAIIAQVPSPTGPREWNRYPAQRSAPIFLEGGKNYYIGAIQTDGTAPDNLAVAWQLPDGTVEGPIPASRLTPYDSDGDGMPDWFERQQGFDPFDPDDGTQDADFDGVSNADEFQRGTNPHYDDVQKVWRGILFENWMGLDDSVEISAMTRSTNFPINPTMKILRADFESPNDFGDSFGTRVRGWVVPPETGDYTFWIAADDRGELWLSADDNPAHRQRIASAPSFTASHEWNKYAEQQSVPIRLEAGKSYYIEAVHKEGLLTDNLAVAWQIPGDSGPEVISARYLIPYNNGLGGEGITREVWTSIPGATVTDLTSSTAFRQAANVYEQIMQLEAPGNWGHNYGQRLRGYVYPPTNGNYTFSISASEAAELWVGTDDTPLNRREIAQILSTRKVGQSAGQRSAPIYLEGGKPYYIEVLHKTGKGADRLSVAWQLPDGTLESPIPATRLSPYDMDGDGMPDWYERRNGLDPHNPDDAQQDADFDGLNNLDEFHLGTNPQLAASNGDGLPDIFVALFGKIDPRSTGSGLLSKAAIVSGAQARAILGRWQVDGSDLYALDRRGLVEFTIPVTNSDMFLLQIEGTQNVTNSLQHTFDLIVSVDGESLGHHILVAGWGTNGFTSYFTPYLKSGSHKVQVLWDGAADGSSLRLKQVVLNTISDPKHSSPNSRMVPRSSAINNDLKNWVRALLDMQSGLDTLTVTNSYTSPCCIEGRDPYVSMMRISDSEGSGTVPALHNIGSRWYANVPLSAQGDTRVNFSYQNGGKNETRVLRWQPLNVLDSTTLTIRQGDSLLLAPPAGFNGTLQVTVKSQSATISTFTTSSSQPVPYQFTQPGTYLINGVGPSRKQGLEQIGSISVQVVGYSFPESPACMVDRLRIWDVTDVPPEVLLEADPALQMTATTDTNTSRQLRLLDDENNSRTIISRLSRGGPILDSTPAKGVRLFATVDTYNNVIEDYPDGSRLAETMFILSPVYTNVSARINIIVGGVTFDDGTIYKELAPGDFDQLGQCKVRFHLPAGTQTANCHTIRLVQGDVVIGTH